MRDFRVSSEFAGAFELDFDLQSTQLAKIDFPGISSEQFALPLEVGAFQALSCAPETPVEQLNGYTDVIHSLNNQMVSVLNATPAGSLLMSPFAQAGNNFVRYVNSLPAEYCIGPNNRGAFDSLNSALAIAVSTFNRGKALFETSVDAFSTSATPLLNALFDESSRIDSSSRDFTRVVATYRSWDSFFSPYNGKIDVWNLTPRIEVAWNQVTSLVGRADTALTRAIAQIETNVETEAQVFDARRRACEATIQYWDEIDGQEGYSRYVETMKELHQTLIPNFNAFLQKVPATDRVKQAVGKAQQALNAIDVGFKSFPDLNPLPASDQNFPYKGYGPADRKFCGGLLQNALVTIAQDYQARTSKPIYIGDLNYQHGGKIKGTKHKSHKLGIDGDVDGTEIGDYPNNNKALALALAKEILETGPQLVFYADPAVVSDANKWAEQNNLKGRLQVEADHYKHFHLRMLF